MPTGARARQALRAQALSELPHSGQRLSEAEEVELARLIEAGATALEELSSAGSSLPRAARRQLETRAEAGLRAREEFIVANLGLVFHLAGKHHPGPDQEDIIQEGMIGLIRAVERFDWRKGFRFSTYATWWIRQAMALAARTQLAGAPTQSEPDSQLLIQARRVTAELEQRYGKSPTREQVASAIGVSPEDLGRTMQLARRHESIDQPLAGGDGELRLEARMEDPHAARDFDLVEVGLMLEQAMTALGELSQRDAYVIEHRFFQEPPLTYAELAEVLQVSRQRVQQIEQRVLVTIRESVSPDSRQETSGGNRP